MAKRRKPMSWAELWSEEKQEMLKLAEALGWPVGMTLTEHDTPTDGMGGEAAWREWVAFQLDGESPPGDELGWVKGIFELVLEIRAAGLDPGPPRTWEGHLIALE